jgi:hypothetical protein
LLLFLSLSLRPFLLLLLPLDFKLLGLLGLPGLLGTRAIGRGVLLGRLLAQVRTTRPLRFCALQHAKVVVVVD